MKASKVDTLTLKGKVKYSSPPARELKDLAVGDVVIALPHQCYAMWIGKGRFVDAGYHELKGVTGFKLVFKGEDDE